jgi:hypothetical protein
MKRLQALFVAVCALLCFSMCATESFSATGDMVIDTRRSYAVESKHFSHVVFRLIGVDKRRINANQMRELKRTLSPRLRQQGCAMLRSTTKEFKYIKKPDGRLEIVLVDHFGRTVLTQNIYWARCK